MNKEWVVPALVLCVIGGFAAGLLVKWPPPRGTSDEGLTLTHPLKGPPDALVKVIEISDFQCPYSSKEALDVLPELFKMYPGKVSVEFWQNPLEFHEHALPAAKAALAAHLQGRFWEMHDFLFRNQNSLGPDLYVVGARQLGLDVDRFLWDMADPRIEEFIASDRAAAGEVGLKGTPMFIVNGRVIQGAQPLKAFARVIDEELAKAQAALAEGTAREALFETLARRNGANEKFLRYFVLGNSPSPGRVDDAHEEKKSPQMITPEAKQSGRSR